jgi:CO/xanthine dehydrogenase Mo-binding subunit
MKFALGQAVPRAEDPRLLTGRGRYTDAFVLPRLAHGFVVRSPHAHACIRSMDTRAAQQMPGVLAVVTGEDWAAEKFGARLPSFRGSDATSPKLWPECPDNECFFFTSGDKRAVNAAFARAHHVTRIKLVFNRTTAATMEPRGVIGDWDDRLGRFTLYVGTQRPHSARGDMARLILHIPETQLRVVAGEVSGSFGMKGGHYPEYALALWASRKIRRPVKWIAKRGEGMLSDDHDRDHVSEAELALDRAELRRRNTVPADAMPFKTGLVYTLDCGKFGENLERALVMADYAGFDGRRVEARGRGRLRGIGFANIIEQTSQAQGETVMVRLDPGGTVTVIPGSISHGQGHETMYKILLSHRLGLDEADIRVAQSDTDLAPDGGGTYASRTAVLGGSAAAMAADKVIAKARKIAAHALEAAEDDIEFADATLRVVGTDRAVSLQEVAAAAFVPRHLPPGLETGLYDVASFSPEIPNFPNGCHVCEVEIDPETGITQVLRYVVVDDVGTVINPLTLAGQIHGGVAQGIGQAFTEHLVYDDGSGQLLTGSLMDYGLPRADEVCSFEMDENPVPTTTNPLGVKGAGKAGNVGALAAIMNAVVDALSPLGVTHMDMPATPEKVWRVIRAAPVEDASVFPSERENTGRIEVLRAPRHRSRRASNCYSG